MPPVKRLTLCSQPSAEHSRKRAILRYKTSNYHGARLSFTTTVVAIKSSKVVSIEGIYSICFILKCTIKKSLKQKKNPRIHFTPFQKMEPTAVDHKSRLHPPKWMHGSVCYTFWVSDGYEHLCDRGTCTWLIKGNILKCRRTRWFHLAFISQIQSKLNPGSKATFRVTLSIIA